MIVAVVLAVGVFLLVGLVGAIAIGIKHRNEHKAEERHYEGAKRSYVSATHLDAEQQRVAASAKRATARDLRARAGEIDPED